MSDLKTEIRSAFENEQGAFPPPPALRRQIVNAVSSAPGQIVHRDEPNLQWLAVAAAVLVTVAIVAGLLAIRIANRPIQVGPPPAGRSLIYVIESRHLSTLVAYDWQGNVRGKIELSSPVDPEAYQQISMSPDGSSFIYQPLSGSNYEYLDRLGQPVAPGFLPDVHSDARMQWPRVRHPTDPQLFGLSADHRSPSASEPAKRLS